MAEQIPADKAGKFDLVQTHLTALDAIKKQIATILAAVSPQLQTLNQQKVDLEAKIESIRKA